MKLFKEELEKLRREKDEWRKEAQAKFVSEDNEHKILVLQEKLQILGMGHHDEKREMEVENTELRLELTNIKEDIKYQAHKLALLQVIVGRMHHLSKEML